MHTFWFAVTLACLVAVMASARQLSHSSVLTGCVATYNDQDGIACIGVVELDAQDCKNFAVYQGQQLQYVTASLQGSSETYCVVAYGSTCQQSITILSQEGDGEFSDCDQATTQSFDQVMSEAIRKGLIEAYESGEACLRSCLWV